MNPCPKILPWRSKPYRKFIESKSCLMLGYGNCRGDIVCHHEGDRDSGMATKASDSYGVPLCAHHHNKREPQGFKTFWTDHKKGDLVNWMRRQQLKLLSEFLGGK